jgi:hypothetical protein
MAIRNQFPQFDGGKHVGYIAHECSTVLCVLVLATSQRENKEAMQLTQYEVACLVKTIRLR